MAPRVCILVRENVLHWAPLYIEAFRQCCDVITAGPGLDVAHLEGAGLGHAAAWRLPNDIVTDAEDARAVLDRLPSGWRPDLVVGLQSAAPAYAGIHDLACPTAYISVDTWHDPGEFQVARHYDHVFVAQRVFVDYLRDGGCRRVHWLPLACAPEHHRPEPVETVYDITFVGTLRMKVNEQRIQRINRLAAAFRVGRQSGAGFEDMRRTCCLGRIAFNSSIAQDVNMRVFETMAMGRPLITNRDAGVNGLCDLFEEGVHYIGYDDDDLVDQARRYLADPAARARMGATARAEVLARHTYRHRVETVLETVLGEAAPPQVGALWRGGDRPADWLPHGTRTVVDVGADMGQSRVALRRHGIERVIGVAPTGAAAQRRARSYDQVFVWHIPPATVAPVDAVVWSLGCPCGERLERLVAWAFGALDRGGTLVLRCAPEEWGGLGLPPERAAWDVWLYDRGFHLMSLHDPGPDSRWHWLTARKYTRHVREMSQEVYDRFPGGHLGGL